MQGTVLAVRAAGWYHLIARFLSDVTSCLPSTIRLFWDKTVERDELRAAAAMAIREELQIRLQKDAGVQGGGTDVYLSGDLQERSDALVSQLYELGAD